MTLQKRLKRIMKQREIRLAELARQLNEPYTTVREWVLFGRLPVDSATIGKRLAAMEKKP
ncbi:MAG TPA: hypothetical protein VN815_15605 [Steroidobacteraceae bacterium]|nr:hypothetical protein [Steroidobacteraceae bacterium]